MTDPDSTRAEPVSAPAERRDGPGALLGWRFGLGVVAGLAGCLVLAWRVDFARIDIGGCAVVLATAVAAGLVWEIATRRARCGFRPLE